MTRIEEVVAILTFPLFACLVLLPACGTIENCPPAGLDALSQAKAVCCEWDPVSVLDDDAWRTAIIQLEAIRDDGVTKAQHLADLNEACSDPANFAFGTFSPSECQTCFTLLVDAIWP